MVRIHIVGPVRLEAGGRILEGRAFGGRQGRLAFVYLAVERQRAVPREELAEILWPGSLPRSWDIAVSAVVSKLRALLRRASLDGQGVLASAFGCYQLLPPTGTWLDIEAAIESLHEAEAALRAEDLRGAYGPAAVACHIARRTFLAGEEGEWVERVRERLRRTHVRACECSAAVYLGNREPILAVGLAEEALALEPFRETAYQLLMRAHAASGNRAEALRAYERCRRLLADELGVDPSPETKAVHLSVLRST